MEQMGTGTDTVKSAKTLLQKAAGNKWVFWLGVIGAAMLLVLSFFDTGDTAPQPETSAVYPSAEAYEGLLEARLVSLLTQVEGAGQVSVMVTLESTVQTVYAQAKEETSDTSAQSGAVSSSRSSYSTDYVLIGGASDRQALAETTLQPVVKGVAVVCSGADDIRVVSRITELVSTVLGIASNRICVTK